MIVKIPPIKIQGIKTKLIPFIKVHLPKSNHGRWIEPFMGSGIVGFNLAGREAVFADINPYIVDFYKKIQSGDISSRIVKEFLLEQSPLLREGGIDYYYEVRDRFNSSHNPLDLLFLNRSCFNGLMRFNRKGKYNVPFGHKPERFAKAYITKICNQILFVENKIHASNWVFLCQSFEETISNVQCGDFVYCDPPYIGRHVDYYDGWDSGNETNLSSLLNASGCNYMVSTWHHNQYRNNDFIDSVWSKCKIITKEHYYHVGAKEDNRNPVVEALLLNYEPVIDSRVELIENQLQFTLL